MAKVTLRARDSSEALALVAERLGPDALILSTEARDGWIEVTATDEPHTKPPARKAQTMLRADIAGHVPRASRTLLRAVMGAKRVLILGPQGAGKSRLALQIATARLEGRAPVTLPRFGFLPAQAHSDAASLICKARLLGETVEVVDPDTWASPPEGRGDLIVVSGALGPSGPELAQGLMVGMGALGLLVLPFGLRRDVVAAQARHWRGLAAALVLSHAQASDCDEDLPQAEEDALAAAGLPLLWRSHPHNLIGGLIGPDLIHPNDPSDPQSGDGT